MTKAAWATDIHLNFIAQERRESFYREILDLQPDVLLISGDIAEGPDVGFYLGEMEAALSLPVLFVLGNHDFYRSSIPRVVRETADLVARSKRLVWLSKSRHVRLAQNTAIVGHDGWGDGRLGDWAGSIVMLSDFFAIAELAEVQEDRSRLIHRLRELGDEAAAHLARVLPEALDACRRVVVLTHVPPFREAAWHQGSISEEDWLPFFSCRATGEVLREAMSRHPDHEMLVLCGHTHGSGEVQILDNLRVLTGGACYGEPRVCRVLQFD